MGFRTEALEVAFRQGFEIRRFINKLKRCLEKSTIKVTSDKLLDSPFKLPYIHLRNKGEFDLTSKVTKGLIQHTLSFIGNWTPCIPIQSVITQEYFTD